MKDSHPRCSVSFISDSLFSQKESLVPDSNEEFLENVSNISSQVKKEKCKKIGTDKLEDCVYCGKTLPRKLLLKHKAKEEKELKCHYCDIKFESVRLLRTHTYRYHKYYSCKICDLKLLKGAYEYHLSSVHRERQECKICHKTFATKLGLTAHMKKIHLGERDERFHCQICGYKAPDHFQYKIHLSRHNKAPSFVCDYCGCRQYTKTELNKHIQADHCGGYICEICQKSFRSPEYLKIHKKVHEPDYDPTKVNFTCEECGNGFFSRIKFRKHLQRHRNKMQTYSCGSCGKSMTSKASFQTHMRMHSGMKPFTCSECEKSFSDKRYLLQHKRLHTAEKVFNCNICGQKFGQYGSLAEHKKTHQIT